MLVPACEYARVRNNIIILVLAVLPGSQACLNDSVNLFINIILRGKIILACKNYPRVQDLSPGQEMFKHGLKVTFRGFACRYRRKHQKAGFEAFLQRHRRKEGVLRVPVLHGFAMFWYP